MWFLRHASGQTDRQTYTKIAILRAPREQNNQNQERYYDLEVATPTAPPLSGRGYHALPWRSHGHSVAVYL